MNYVQELKLELYFTQPLLAENATVFPAKWALTKEFAYHLSGGVKNSPKFTL